MGKTSCKNHCMVLRYGRTCSKVLGKTMRIGEKEGRAKFQSFQSLLGSFIQEGRIGTSWRTLRGSITDGEMLPSGTIGRPDILWSVNRLARSVTKWTQACDRRLARLISYIHHASVYRQYCHVGNTAQLRRLGLFQDSDLVANLGWSSSSEAEHLSLSVECVKSKRQYLMVLQNLKLFRRMLDCEWMDYLLSIYGML